MAKLSNTSTDETDILLKKLYDLRKIDYMEGYIKSESAFVEQANNMGLSGFLEADPDINNDNPSEELTEAYKDRNGIVDTEKNDSINKGSVAIEKLNQAFDEFCKKSEDYKRPAGKELFEHYMQYIHKVIEKLSSSGYSDRDIYDCVRAMKGLLCTQLNEQSNDSFSKDLEEDMSKEELIRQAREMVDELSTNTSKTRLYIAISAIFSKVTLPSNEELEEKVNNLGEDREISEEDLAAFLEDYDEDLMCSKKAAAKFEKLMGEEYLEFDALLGRA